MGLIKWIKRELDSSNTCKRRQSEPPLPGSSSQSPRDESYVKALSKFNEWREKQKIGGTSRLTRKQSKKLIERRGQSDTFFENRNIRNNKETISKNVTTIDNSLYEEIQLSQLQAPQNDFSSCTVGKTLEVIPIRHSIPTTNITSALVHTNSSVKHPNELYENVSNFDTSGVLNTSKRILSPPIKFFKENSNPFVNVITPNRNEGSKDVSERIYEIPRDLEALDALRATFKQIEASVDHIRDSASSGKLNRFPPYQTVINKHGDEVEYALPLNEKLDDGIHYNREVSNGKSSAVVALDNTSNYQQYIEKNFEFLNEKDGLLVSGMSSVSFNINQFQRKNVPVTDLDKTNGTKGTNDQNISKDHNIIQELESLETWSRNIGKDIQNNTVKKEAINMHFAEIIVCKTQDVVEKEPRVIFEALNGSLHAGTFHCVPVTQFKPHRKENMCGDSILQMNYEVLRKIRHPDISLLMGITVDNKCALDSLILEPLDYSLNHFIHTEATCIPIPVCLLYTLQITNAVTYLHKNGLIHSNISSHTIFMCNLSKSVKLTSFELITTQDSDLREELMSVFQNNNQCINDISQVPYKLRPYNTNYRKTFTRHNYQAPELLSITFPFVFPKIQSDIYGICLTLWEMVSCSTPYNETTYDDMVQLIHLQNAQLPTIQAERQKHFEYVLQLGLNLEAGKRVSDTNKLNEVLKNISVCLEDKTHDDKLLSIKENDDIPDLLSPKIFGPMVYERNSTIKKRNNLLDNNHMSVRKLFAYSQINKTKGMIPSHTSSPNSPKCGFEIGEVSIPETPIARSNKLRKTAWLSNQSISPIVHLEIKSKDDDTAINQIQIVENKIPNSDSTEDACSNKLYNVNIRIRPTPKKSNTPNKSRDNSFSGAENCSLIPSNKNTSHISDHIKFFNSVSQSKTQQELPQQNSKTTSPVENYVNYDKNTTKPDLKPEKNLNQHLDPVITQKSINEFFSRNQSIADFENSLWRREKQKCDQSVKSPRRISVKDAVSKFESFSKSMLSETNSPKARRTPTAYTSGSDENKILTPNLDVSPEEGDSRRGISKLNVVLQNKDCTNEKIAKEIKENPEGNDTPECCDISKEQSPMLTLNFKKLDRRASDLSSYFIRRNPKNKALAARHSIYGTDIYKRLRKAKTFTEVEGDDHKEGSTTEPIKGANLFQDKRKDFKIKVGKLACFNCGHKLFVFDDVVSSNKGENVNEPCTELLLTPLGRNSGLQVTKSIEDFYIDDDFCEDIELCANMELGTGSRHSDPTDFDIFSAEIFNPTEEKAHLFA